MPQSRINRHDSILRATYHSVAEFPDDARQLGRAAYLGDHRRGIFGQERRAVSEGF